MRFPSPEIHDLPLQRPKDREPLLGNDIFEGRRIEAAQP